MHANARRRGSVARVCSRRGKRVARSRAQRHGIARRDLGRDEETALREGASWSLLVTDLATGKTVYALDPDRLAFSGSVRKLFSVGVALNQLGAGHRFTTPGYRSGSVDANGALRGNLVLVGAGDLTLGGRLLPSGNVAITTFDHNDANNLGTAILTPQDPLRGLNDLARQVRAAGIRSVMGNVVIDDRLFQTYRVPNGNFFITPLLVNENMVDVTASPAQQGAPARVDWRPKTPAFSVTSTLTTSASGSEPDVTLLWIRDSPIATGRRRASAR